MLTHKDLDVWKYSVKFVTDIYRVTNHFPHEELFGITSQIRRAAVSIPTNISEGAARKSKKEFNQFLYIALGSASEVETLLIISKELGYIKTTEEILSQLTSISKMLQGLIKSLKIH